MEESDAELTPKELAERSNISYSTLAPILRGERDFRISNLIALAEALNVTPNEILNGLYKAKDTSLNSKTFKAPKYYVILVTGFGLTYCRLVDLTQGNTENAIYHFSLACTNEPKTVIEKIKMAITSFKYEIAYSEIYLYLSVLGCEHVFGREHISKELRKTFGMVIIEPDWMPVYKSLLENKNGILISINNGSTIAYSNDKGKNIVKLQGYSFPVSDDAGNLWLGCEAIKHAINVKEAVESRSMLSDKILGVVNSDLNLLATKAYDHPHEFFAEVATIVKELASKKDMAYEIVKRGFNLIWQRILIIDKKLNKKLPIYLSGSLAYLYEEFVPKDRVMKVNFEHIVEDQLSYAYKKLDEVKQKMELSKRI
jgi:N-acetylglucosamine kinase-like BadF-type ATPase